MLAACANVEATANGGDAARHVSDRPWRTCTGHGGATEAPAPTDRDILKESEQLLKGAVLVRHLKLGEATAIDMVAFARGHLPLGPLAEALALPPLRLLRA
mmetsp:Transcript_25500/g.75383  ORF Transcript_25500/g.75383 Transcript_25500/m.75383 type:complete len:101 (-) Transcript_25500:664-966(-)